MTGLLATIAKRGSSLSAITPWMAVAVTASQAHTEQFIEDASKAIQNAGDLNAATRTLAGFVSEWPIDDMVELNRQFILASELYGRAIQFDRIARRRRTVSNSRTRGEPGARASGSDGRRVVVNASASIQFSRLPFDEAIAALRDRIGIDPQTFENLDREARSRAFRVAGVWNLELLSAVHEELVSAIASGATMRDFRKSLPEMADRDGWSGENPWHSNLVFFQNAAMAYAAGAYRQMIEGRVEAWRFVSNGESCPICEPEIGKVYSINDTDRIPPLHFNCDCDQEPVFEEELATGTEALRHEGTQGPVQLNDSSREPNPALETSRNPEGNPDAGFKFDVKEYGALPPLDLSKFPLDLRAAFRALAAQQGWEILE